MKLKNLLKEEKLVEIELKQKLVEGVKFTIRFYPKDGIINCMPANTSELDKLNKNKEKVKLNLQSYLAKMFRLGPITEKSDSNLSGINFMLYDTEIQKLILNYLK